MTRPMKQRPGAPGVPRGERGEPLEKSILLKVTPEVHAAVVRDARAVGVTVSEWIRRAIVALLPR